MRILFCLLKILNFFGDGFCWIVSLIISIIETCFCFFLFIFLKRRRRKESFTLTFSQSTQRICWLVSHLNWLGRRLFFGGQGTQSDTHKCVPVCMTKREIFDFSIWEFFWFFWYFFYARYFGYLWRCADKILLIRWHTYIWESFYLVSRRKSFGCFVINNWEQFNCKENKKWIWKYWILIIVSSY